ncbi:MAG: hypothetical protein AAF620_17505 [Bacteroidota bacterium]
MSSQNDLPNNNTGHNDTEPPPNVQGNVTKDNDEHNTNVSSSSVESVLQGCADYVAHKENSLPPNHRLHLILECNDSQQIQAQNSSTIMQAQMQFQLHIIHSKTVSFKNCPHNGAGLISNGFGLFNTFPSRSISGPSSLNIGTSNTPILNTLSKSTTPLSQNNTSAGPSQATVDLETSHTSKDNDKPSLNSKDINSSLQDQYKLCEENFRSTQILPWFPGECEKEEVVFIDETSNNLQGGRTTTSADQATTNQAAEHTSRDEDGTQSKRKLSYVKKKKHEMKSEEDTLKISGASMNQMEQINQKKILDIYTKFFTTLFNFIKKSSYKDLLVKTKKWRGKMVYHEFTAPWLRRTLSSTANEVVFINPNGTLAVPHVRSLRSKEGRRKALYLLSAFYDNEVSTRPVLRKLAMECASTRLSGLELENKLPEIQSQQNQNPTPRNLDHLNLSGLKIQESMATPSLQNEDRSGSLDNPSSQPLPNDSPLPPTSQPILERDDSFNPFLHEIDTESRDKDFLQMTNDAFGAAISTLKQSTSNAPNSVKVVGVNEANEAKEANEENEANEATTESTANAEKRLEATPSAEEVEDMEPKSTKVTGVSPLIGEGSALKEQITGKEKSKKDNSKNNTSQNNSTQTADVHPIPGPDLRNLEENSISPQKSSPRSLRKAKRDLVKLSRRTITTSNKSSSPMNVTKTPPTATSKTADMPDNSQKERFSTAVSDKGLSENEIQNKHVDEGQPTSANGGQAADITGVSQGEAMREEQSATSANPTNFSTFNAKISKKQREALKAREEQQALRRLRDKRLLDSTIRKTRSLSTKKATSAKSSHTATASTTNALKTRKKLSEASGRPTRSRKRSLEKTAERKEDEGGNATEMNRKNKKMKKSVTFAEPPKSSSPTKTRRTSKEASKEVTSRNTQRKSNRLASRKTD